MKKVQMVKIIVNEKLYDIITEIFKLIIEQDKSVIVLKILMYSNHLI